MRKSIPLALVILAVAGLLLWKPWKSSPTASPQAQNRTAATETKIGSATIDNDFRFTVKKVECDKPWAGNPGDRDIHQLPQGHFCEAQVTVENISKSSKDFIAEGQNLLGSDGKKYSVGLAFYGPDHIPSPWQALRPGNPIEAILIYDIPKPTKPLFLELRDNPSSPGLRVDISNYKKYTP